MRQIMFSGDTWTVKSSSGDRLGPGNNVFSDAADAVWIDAETRLHLTIRQHKHVWHCTEVIGPAATGFGRYRFQVESSPAFDRNVVAAVFLYRDDRHEIDIELSEFGSVAGPANAQYVVQPLPGRRDGFIQRFSLRSDWSPMTHEIDWGQDMVEFRSIWNDTDVVASGTASGPVPEGLLTPRINLWLFAGPAAQGQPPADGCEAHFVIRSFSHTPFA